MAMFRNRSMFSFLIILLGILFVSIATYALFGDIMKPIKYKDLGADYQFWFDSNSLESTGTIDKNLVIVGSAEIAGYDYEGLHVLDPSSYANLDDGGTYDSLTFAEFVYIDTNMNIDRIAELGRWENYNRNLFTFYIENNRLCFRTYLYSSLSGINETYSECTSDPISPGWHSIGLRWTSGSDVEVYLDGARIFSVPYNNTSFRLNYAAFFGDVIHDEIKIFFSYVDDITLERALNFYGYPISKSTYNYVQDIFMIVFFTTLIITLGVFKAIKRPVQYYAPVYLLAILETLLSLFLLFVVVSVLTGVDVIGFIHVAQIGGYADYIIKFVALAVLVVHLALIYEAMIRT